MALVFCATELLIFTALLFSAFKAIALSCSLHFKKAEIYYDNWGENDFEC